MFTKKEIFSIPNVLCYFRILLVPVFLYFYVNGYHLTSAFILLVSSLSDFLDGYIARHYNMITELGSLIDPIADKLTQLVVACTLVYTYPAYLWMIIIIFLKDGMLLFVGWFIYRRTREHLKQAEMPGKIATAVFFMVSIILIACHPNPFFACLAIYLTVGLMVIAMVYYGFGLYHLYNDNK